MKVSAKLKHTELQTLSNFMETVLMQDFTNGNFGRKEAIVSLLMFKFYKKLKEKCIILEPREYSFQFPAEIAMAFVEYFTFQQYSPASHLGNTVQKLITSFDQQTANFYNR